MQTDLSRSHFELSEHPAFQVGAWLVEPALNRITGRGSSTRVEPKVMQVLLLLAEQPGAPVTREDLLDTVWAGTVVEENALSRAVSQLRKAFHDDPRNPQVVETIPKTGYCLIAPVYLPPEPSPGTPSVGTRGDSSPRTADDVGLAATPQAPGVARPRVRPRWLVVLVLLCLAVVAGFGLARWLAGPPPAPLTSIPFTSRQGLEVSPAFSPDGRQVAYVQQSTAQNDGDLYVQLVGTEAPLQLTDTPAIESSPAWSPDGRAIAFLRFTREDCGIFTLPALGGTARRVGGCGGQIFPSLSWSPDGRHLVFSTRPTPTTPYRVVLFELDTGALSELTSPEGLIRGDVNAAFSPDGRWISFLRRHSTGIEDLYLVPVEGGTPRRLTSDDHYIAGYDWMPDGRSLVVSSNRSGNFGFWRVPASGGAPAWFPVSGLYDPGTPTFPRVPGPTTMAYVEWFFDYNLWQQPLATASGEAAAPRQRIASTRWERHPDLAPDGARVAFMSNRSGYNEIWVDGGDGGDPARLTAFEGAYVGVPRWSPDGRRLALEARPSTHTGIFVMHSTGGAPLRLTDEAADALLPSWSPDGQWIYYTSNRDGSWQIWKRPAGGGAPVQVTHEGGYGAALDPEARFLYHARRDEAGLWRIPAEGGAAERTDIPLALGDWGNWTIQASGLYYAARDSAALHIARFDPDSGETTYYAAPNGALPSGQPSLSISPDGAYALYTRLDRLETDIKLATGK